MPGASEQTRGVKIVNANALDRAMTSTGLTPAAIMVTAMQPEDWAAVRDIYAQGIRAGDATFETDVPRWESWDAAHLATLRLVARRGDQVVGWAAAVPVSERCVYGGVVEDSVYVAAEARGQGIGRQLLAAIIASCEAAGIWTIQSGVFPENVASLRLHEACGFRRVGVRERIGQHHGRWRDVVLLERRRRDD
ncbi:MAG: GNAT family N-acetyltransferase [Candidatus Dormibacteria bacterium]